MRGMGYAVMKDKRRVTTQFCTAVSRKVPHDLLSINREKEDRRGGGGGDRSNGGYGIMRVGGLKYVDRYISLGILRGNRFRIVLRNVCAMMPG